MSFIRCDQGATPSDHHMLALTLGAANGYVHSAYADDHVRPGPVGPRATSEFLDTKPGPHVLRDLWGVVSALQADNEFDVQRLRGFINTSGSAPV